MKWCRMSHVVRYCFTVAILSSGCACNMIASREDDMTRGVRLFNASYPSMETDRLHYVYILYVVSSSNERVERVDCACLHE